MQNRKSSGSPSRLDRASATRLRPVKTRQTTNNSPQHKTRLKDVQNLDIVKKLDQQINALEGDKVQYVKRLNMVLEEVDKVNAEKADLMTQLSQEKNRVEELSRTIRQAPPPGQDRQLQKDLFAEKEEVMRLRSIINHLEIEKSQMRKRLSDIETEATQVYRENSQIVSKLHDKDETASLLDADNRSLQERVRSMADQIADYEAERVEFMKERARLHDELHKAQNEKADSLLLANDWADKFDTFNATVSNEKENLVWLHNRHTRLISSRSIYLQLERFILRVQSGSLSKIKWFKSFREGKSKSTHRLWHVLTRYTDNRLASSFRKWTGILNWKSVAQSRDCLANRYANYITISRVFTEWKSEVSTAQRLRNKQDLALRTIYKLLGISNHGSLSGRFALWANKTNFAGSCEKSIARIIQRKYNASLRQGLAKFQRALELSQQEQCREDLATELASLHFKHAVFSALKNATFNRKIRRVTTDLQEEHSQKLYTLNIEHEMQRAVEHSSMRKAQVSRVVRMVTHKDAQKAFNTWRGETKEWKQLQTWVTKFQRDNIENTKSWLERCYYAWKQYKTQAKLDKTVKQLEIEKPRRIELEIGLTREQNAHKRNIQKSACRVATKMFGGALKSYFDKWAETAFYFRFNQVRVKNMILHHYHLRLKTALTKWRTNTTQENLNTLSNAKEILEGQNQALRGNIETLESDVQKREAERALFKCRRAVDAMKRFYRLNKRRAMHMWARVALSTANKIAAAVRIEAEIKQRFMYNAMNRILSNMYAKQRKQGREFRMKKFISAKNDEFKRYLYTEWVKFVQGRKRFYQSVMIYWSRYQTFQMTQKWNQWVRSGLDAQCKQLEDKTIHLEGEIDVRHHKITDLEEQLGKAENQLTHAHYKAKAAGGNSICNLWSRLNRDNSYRLMHKWRQNTIHGNRQSRYVSRMQLISNTQLERKAFRLWSCRINKLMLSEAATAIAGHVREKKEMRREAASVKSEMEKTIIERDMTIEGHVSTIGKLNTRTQRMLAKSVSSAKTDFSLNKAHYCFTMWAARYRRMRRAMKKLVKISYATVLKYSIFNIKATATESLKHSNVQSTLRSAFKRYSHRGLKNLFYQWKRTAMKRTTRLYENEIAEYQAENNAISLHRHTICRNSRQKAYNVITRNTKSGIFNAWVAITSQLRRIRFSRTAAESAVSTMRLKSALRALVQEKSMVQIKHEKNSAAEMTYARNIMQQTLNTWHFVKERNKYMQGILGMQDNRYVLVSLVSAFNYIKTAANVNSLTLNHQIDVSTKALTKSFSRLSILHQRRRFTTWKAQTVRKEISYATKRAAFLRALHGKLRSAWVLWKENETVGDFMREAETEGPVAVENTALKNRVDILEELVKKEGIDPKYVEEYILEKESVKDAMIRKSVHRLQYNAKQQYTKVDTENILPRAFLSWRMFILKKKRVFRAAVRCWSRLRKADLFHAFREWKQGFPLVANTLGKLPRQQIYGIVAKMDSDIKQMETVMEEQSGQLTYLQHYSNLLEDHTRRGQNQALAYCRQNVEKTLARAMFRWMSSTHQSRMSDLANEYSNLEEDYYTTRQKLDQVHGDNTELVAENAELRQASLDGIAIADAIEGLSLERDKLSTDVADRAATIKRLLDENTELNYRLQQAQRGGTTPPERDIPSQYVRNLRH